MSNDDIFADKLRDIERDFEWRQHELFHARELFIGATHPEHRNVLLRSLVMLLYAHFEGFTKFCLQTYLLTLSDMEITCCEVRSELIAYSLRQKFRTLIGKGSPSHRRDFIDEFRHLLNDVIQSGRVEIDTKSNLKSEVLSDLIEELGLEYPGGIAEFLNKETTSSIDTVTNKRNAVAHGKSVSISDFDKYKVLERDVLSVMNNIVRLVEYNLKSGSYKYAGT